MQAHTKQYAGQMVDVECEGALGYESDAEEIPASSELYLGSYYKSRKATALHDAENAEAHQFMLSNNRIMRLQTSLKR